MVYLDTSVPNVLSQRDLLRLLSLRENYLLMSFNRFSELYNSDKVIF